MALDIFVNWFCPFSDAFFDSATGMPATSAQKAAAVLMSEQENNLNNLQNSPEKQADVPQNAAATTNRRLTQEGLKYEKIKKCTGIILLIFNFMPWTCGKKRFVKQTKDIKNVYRVMKREIWDGMYEQK